MDFIFYFYLVQIIYIQIYSSEYVDRILMINLQF